MSGRHVPFSKRHDPEAIAAHQDALHEGVPAHLRSTFREFLTATITRDNLPEIERSLEFRVSSRPGESATSTLIQRCMQDEDLCLDVTHERLGRLYADVRDHAGIATDLAVGLAEGGSAYRVTITPEDEHGNEHYGLEDRVDPAVRASAEAAMAHGRSGVHLRAAWGAAYGRYPDPNTAYGEAIKAVEAAAARVVIPNAKEPTLGQIVTALRDAPAGKFEVVLVGKNDAADPVNIVRLMAQLLWTHDHARHGTADESKPINVTKEQAEAAVHLAATLVQWFETGGIRRA